MNNETNYPLTDEDIALLRRPAPRLRAKRELLDAMLAAGAKACHKCDTVKSVHAFRPSKHKRDGLAPHCRPCCREVQAAWVKASPEKARANWQKSSAKYKAKCRRDRSPRFYAMRAQENAARRARKLNQTPDYCSPGTEAYAAIQDVYDLADQMGEIVGCVFEVDHIIALSNGGLHEPSNLTPLRADLNREKNGREDWTPPANEFARVTYRTRRST